MPIFGLISLRNKQRFALTRGSIFNNSNPSAADRTVASPRISGWIISMQGLREAAITKATYIKSHRAHYGKSSASRFERAVAVDSRPVENPWTLFDACSVHYSPTRCVGLAVDPLTWLAAREDKTSI
jgi:hypothetical protein